MIKFKKVINEKVRLSFCVGSLPLMGQGSVLLGSSSWGTALG